MTVLVVDDSRVMRSVVVRALQHAGYGEHATVQAASGAEALQALQAGAPDLVLSDWTMAAMTGLELLHAVRAAGLGVPFGFIAASGDPDMRRAARAAGADFFLAKPFTTQALREALAAVLERPPAPPHPEHELPRERAAPRAAQMHRQGGPHQTRLRGAPRRVRGLPDPGAQAGERTVTAPAVDEQTRAYVVVEVRTRPPLSRLYPPQQSLACAVEAYAHANALPVARPMTCLREGEEQAWQLDVHSGGRALVLAVDPYDPGAVPALTDDGLLATTTPRPTRAPRPVLTRVCDVCRQDCTYLDQHTAGPRTARPPRWGCREHGPRPSPVLVRR